MKQQCFVKQMDSKILVEEFHIWRKRITLEICKHPNKKWKALKLIEEILENIP